MKIVIDHNVQCLGILYKYEHYNKFPVNFIVASIRGDNYDLIHPPTLHIYDNIGNDKTGTL
jgi:hypothetical protein